MENRGETPQIRTVANKGNNDFCRRMCYRAGTISAIIVGCITKNREAAIAAIGRSLIMIIFSFIPLGLLMGYIMYKIKSEFWAYMVGITPYLIFFLLSIDDRDIWGHLRVIALFSTAVACLFCFIARKIKQRKDKKLNSNSDH